MGFRCRQRALLIILGVAFLLTIPLSSSFLTAARLVTLSGVSAAVRGLVFLTVGLLLLVIGARHIFGMFQEGALGGRQTKYLLQDLHRYRTRTRGPTIVAIGGGTGLATLLRGLKAYTRNITAVVTVADDGEARVGCETSWRFPLQGMLVTALWPFPKWSR